MVLVLMYSSNFGVAGDFLVEHRANHPQFNRTPLPCFDKPKPPDSGVLNYTISRCLRRWRGFYIVINVCQKSR